MEAISKRRRIRSRYAGVWSCATVSSLRLRSSIAVQALEQLGAAVIVTDSDGRVVEMNRAAETMVQLADGLIIRGDQLCARRVFETAKVAKLIAAAALGETSGDVGRMLVRRSDGRPAYVLTVAPLRADPAVDDRRLAMIVVVDPERHSPSEKDLAEFFGLSPAEARLAAALLTGKTLSRIADSSGIRITTLRTQLAAILRKVGAQRQSDLVRILSGTGIGSLSLGAGWLDVPLAVAQIPLSLAGI